MVFQKTCILHELSQILRVSMSVWQKNASLAQPHQVSNLPLTVTSYGIKYSTNYTLLNAVLMSLSIQSSIHCIFLILKWILYKLTFSHSGLRYTARFASDRASL